MTYRYGQKLRVKTYLGDIKEGIVKEVNQDGSLFVELDEQILPNLSQDLVIRDKRGKPFVIYKSKFPNWQAWVLPEWVVSILPQEKREGVV